MKRGTNYDLIVHRVGGSSFGYMCEWGEDGSAPASVESAPPDIPVSTSAGVTQAGGQFSARDAAPPFPIEVNNWQDGAGQFTYDNASSSPEAYRSSQAVDVTQDSHFELGPRVIHFPDWWMSNKMLAALGTFWAGFVPDDGDQPLSLRFLHRYTVTSGSGAGDYLTATDDTSLIVSDATDVADLVLADALAAPIPANDTACTMGDYLYCPTHNEVIRVTAVAGTTLTVERGKAGTTAASHTASETWYGFNWTPVSMAETEPTQALSALATDGKYVYAAFHNAGSDNGSVWRGVANDTADQFASWSTANNIVALCYCGGYMYGAQDNLTGVTSVGWFNTGSSNGYDDISLTGAVASGASTAGLAAVGNYVYWAVTDGMSRSWVYRLQHTAAADTFELVRDLPAGFIATCIHSHLGNLYVGGYVDTLATVSGDTSLPQYEGAVYLVAVDGEAQRVVNLRNFPDESVSDTRVKGMCSAGPYIYILANEDTYVYDATHGGWSHYVDSSTSSIAGLTESLDWTPSSVAGFDWTQPGGGNEPDDTDAILADWATWDGDTDGYVDAGEVIVDQSTSSGFTKTLAQWGNTFYYSVSAGKYYRWTLDGAPTSQATVEVKADYLQSQAGCIIIGGTDHEVRAHLQGIVSGGVVTGHRIGLGYMDDPTGGITDYSYKWSGLQPKGTHTYRITFSSSGAAAYIDGVLAVSVEHGKLRHVSDSNATTFRWSVGWPGDPQTDKNIEKIRYQYVKFTSAGAYAPNYSGGALTTTGMEDIATQQGITIIPVPGNGTSSAVGTIGGWDYINSKEVSAYGWLETSDSALHMGSIDKYFTSVMVEHTPIRDSQTLQVMPILDDAATGSQSGEELSTLTTAGVYKSGKKIRARVTLTESDPNRPYSERLRISRVTGRFFTVNSPHVHTYYLNCREGVQARNGRDWGYDPEEAIRHLFAAADSGEVVYIESLFTSDVNEGEETEGKQLARVEMVKLFKGPGDKDRYDKLEGTVMVKLRRVDEASVDYLSLAGGA